MVLSKLTFIPNTLMIISIFYAVALIPPIAPKLSPLEFVLEYAETVPLTRNLSKEVKNTRIILWVVDIYPIRLKYNLTKLKRSQEGPPLTPKHGIRRSCFQLLQFLTHIYPTSTKLLVTIAILSILHPHYHSFFIRVPLSHLFRVVARIFSEVRTIPQMPLSAQPHPPAQYLKRWDYCKSKRFYCIWNDVTK